MVVAVVVAVVVAAIDAKITYHMLSIGAALEF